VQTKPSPSYPFTQLQS